MAHEGANAMNAVRRVRGWLFVIPCLVIGCGLLPSRVSADPLTVTWDVVPREDGELDDTPYYSCTGSEWPERRCQYLWEQGVELYAVGALFYDDKWFDGEGFGDPAEGVMGVRPRCEPALAPCFDTFTPTRLELDGFSEGGPGPNLFVQSSRGGVVKLPGVERPTVVDFTGSQWLSIEWLEVGFYLPAECEWVDPPVDVNCDAGDFKAFVIDSLTFEPDVESVPEPSLIVLLATGLVGLVGRRRARSRPGRSDRPSGGS